MITTAVICAMYSVGFFFNYSQRKYVFEVGLSVIFIFTLKFETLSGPVNLGWLLHMSELGLFIENKEKDSCLFRHAYLYLTPKFTSEEEIIGTVIRRNNNG